MRVVVLADICLYREGLRQVLSRSHRVDVAGTAGDVQAALELVREVEPDVVLLDFETPDTAALITALLEVAPTTKVVPLAVRETADDVIAWAEAGASGYVSREASLEDLVGTIEGVARGERHPVLPVSRRCSSSASARLRGKVARNSPAPVSPRASSKSPA